MEKRIVLLVIMLYSSLRLSAQQDTTLNLSLKQCYQIAIEKNVDIYNAEFDQQKSLYSVKESQSKLYPQIDAYSDFKYNYAIPTMVLPGEIFGQSGQVPVQIGSTFDWSGGFRASQVLYNQSYFTSIKVSRQMAGISKLNVTQKKEEIIYQVTQVYYLCQATQKQIELLGITLKNTDRLLEISKLQSENGVIRKADYSRVSVNKFNLQTQIDNLRQLYSQQLGLLKYLIGLENNAKISLSDSLTFTNEFYSIESLDFNNRTEIKLLNKQWETTFLTRKANIQSYLPTLSGFAQYYYQGQRNEFDYFGGGRDKFFETGVVGLSLSIPIFDGFEKHYKIKHNNIDLRQIENSKKNTQAYFTKEYHDAVEQYNNSMEILERQAQSMEIAGESYRINLQGYQQQIVTLSDLILSEKELIESRLSYYNALLLVNNSALNIKKAKGELLNF